MNGWLGLSSDSVWRWRWLWLRVVMCVAVAVFSHGVEMLIHGQGVPILSSNCVWRWSWSWLWLRCWSYRLRVRRWDSSAHIVDAVVARMTGVCHRVFPWIGRVADWHKGWNVLVFFPWRDRCSGAWRDACRWFWVDWPARSRKIAADQSGLLQVLFCPVDPGVVEP